MRGPRRSVQDDFCDVPRARLAILFGALFANEAITTPIIAGGVINALGTTLSTGMLDIRSFLRRSGVFATRLAFVVAAACALGDTVPDIHAAEVNVPVYLSTNTYSSRPATRWETFSTLAASGELQLVSADRSRVASVFAEYHVSDDVRVDGATFAGVSAGYRLHRWDVKGYWFAAQFPGSAGRQNFKVRLRHQLGDRHKLGIEYLARVDAPGSGQVKLGYYATIRPGLTLKLLLGADLDRTGMPMARLGISWQAR